MSYNSWHNYGYGICTDHIKVDNPAKVENLLRLAPKYHQQVWDWLKECEIGEPTVDDYLEFDQDYCLGLATLLKEVMEEAEGIQLVACDDRDCAAFLIYPQLYPWQIGEKDRDLTEEKLRALFAKYVSILTDTPITVEEQAVGNGG